MESRLSSEQFKLMTELWGFSEFHIRYEWADLTKVNSKNIESIKEYIKDFTLDKDKIFERLKKSIPPGLFLQSSTTGTAKTVLAHLVAKDILLDSKRIRKMKFIHGVALMVELKSTFNPHGGIHESEVLDNIMESDILFIDDFDKLIRWSDYERERFTLILDSFYTKMSPIIITSNTTIEELFRQGKLERHTYSRLMQMCKIETVDATDYRVDTKLHLEPKKKDFLKS